MRISFIILTVIVLLLPLHKVQAGQWQHLADSKNERYINALISFPKFGRVYVEDGAADGSVTSHAELPAPVKDILDLRSKAIPLLIQHLDDTRLTSATFEGGFTWGKPLRVPVGHVCLDILTHIIGHNLHIYIKDCGDDGLGACIKGEYYFRPDEYYPAGKIYIARDGVRVVKANWLKAYRKGLLKYHSLSW